MLDRAAALTARYASRVRAMWFVMVAACSAPPKPSPAPAAQPAPVRDLAVAEPPPKPRPPEEPLIDPSDPSARNEWLVRGMDRPRGFDAPIRRRVMPPPQELDVAERDLWSPCVRDFVQAQPVHARRPLTAVFSRYGITCDATKRVVVASPQDVRGKPFLGYSATFTNDRAELVLNIATCGVSFDRAVIVYDGKTWTSGGLVVENVDGCATASLPDVRSIRRMLRDMLDARNAVVRIDGAEDMPITDEMKHELRLMLDAYDALSVR